MEPDWGVDAGVNALVNQAVAGGALQSFTGAWGEGHRHPHVCPERIDAARTGRHFLLDRNLDAIQVEIVLLGLNAEDGGDAGAQRRGHEVGGRKGPALPMVVLRGVGGEGHARWHVLGLAAQVPDVTCVDLNHRTRR